MPHLTYSEIVYQMLTERMLADMVALGVDRKYIAKELGYKNKDYVTHLKTGKRKLPKNRFETLKKLYTETVRMPRIIFIAVEIVPGEFLREIFDISFEAYLQLSERKILDELRFCIRRKLIEGVKTGRLYYPIFFKSRESLKKIEKYYSKNLGEFFLGAFYQFDRKRILAVITALICGMYPMSNLSSFFISLAAQIENPELKIMLKEVFR